MESGRRRERGVEHEQVAGSKGELRYSYPYPCQEEFYKLPTAPMSSTEVFCKTVLGMGMGINVTAQGGGGQSRSRGLEHRST